MDRRTFMKSVGVAAGALAAGSALAACGRDQDGGIPQGDPTLTVIVASFETLVGEQLLAFGVRRNESNEELTDADLDVYLRNLDGNEIVAGPVDAEFSREAGPALGLYSVTVEFPEPGTYELVAVHGEEFGSAALRVVTPEQSELPAPTQAAIVTPTPTPEDPLGYELAEPDEDNPVAQICTQDPPCGMHEVSLDAALEAGRPVMLVFATPEFCQTAVCGPAVETIDEVRASEDWGDVAWIHCEIFAGRNAENLGEPVQAWQLPSEPWLFSIGKDGVIADRRDGPMLPKAVSGMASEIAS